MKVLKIQKNKILFENNVEISLQSKTIKEYKLKEGLDLEQEIYLYLLESAMLSFSYWLLAKRDYGKKELEDKLYLKYRSRNISLKILNKLEEEGYLDDEAYAISFINAHKKWGVKKLEYHLILKGINKEIIRELLTENNESQLEEIKKIWIKLGDKEERKKIESLMRKGFNYEDIKKTLRDWDDID